MKRISPYQIFLLFILLMSGYCLAPVANATIYKWVDENGTLHFGDTPSQNMQPQVQIELVPPSQAYSHIERPQAKKKQLKQVSKKMPVGKQEPTGYSQAEVELYTTSWCHYCKKAHAFFNGRGVPFSEYDIEIDAEAAVRKQEIDSRPGVPFALVNGQAIHGFLPQAYEQALQAGLP